MRHHRDLADRFVILQLCGRDRGSETSLREFLSTLFKRLKIHEAVARKNETCDNTFQATSCNNQNQHTPTARKATAQAKIWLDKGKASSEQSCTDETRKGFEP
jgi:hypothetical protein